MNARERVGVADKSRDNRLRLRVPQLDPSPARFCPCAEIHRSKKLFSIESVRIQISLI